MAVILGSHLLFVVTSCSNKSRKIWASVNQIELTEKFALQVMSARKLDIENPSEKSKFIEEWITNTKMGLYLSELNQNSFNLSQSQSQEYLTTLQAMYIENELVKNQLNTFVSEEEILSYYKKHRENYTEQNFIVKALYIKVPNNFKEKSALEKHFVLKNDKDKQEVKKIANLYATNFYYEESKWIVFDDLVREIPFDTDKNTLILRRGEYVTSTKDFTYYLNILDYKLKDATSPLSSERKKITDRILSLRINDLKKTLKKKIEQTIENKYEVEYYLD